jgi:parallel beta-helix repeat protein
VLVNCKTITVKNLTLSYNGEGILLAHTTNSIITQNTLANMSAGIRFYGSSNNQIIGNNITNNGYGIYFSGGGFLSTYYPSPNNIFYHNNFVNNQRAVYDIADEGSPWVPVSSPPVNIWDDGYASGGNYWGYYTSGDNDGDGIGDTPIIINENNRDNYPLMAPVQNTNQYTFFAGTWESQEYYVHVTSNSTIANFQFNPSEGAFIRFTVEGESGTVGFCRITIPKELIQTEENWIVLVNENPVTPTVNKDPSNTYMYFIYPHGTKTIEIKGTTVIPEFPSWIILPLILTAIALIIICKQKLPKTPNQHRILED